MTVRCTGTEIVELTVENPPGNTLSMQTLVELRVHLERIGADPAVRCVVLAAGAGPFISGGDVTELLASVGDPEAIGAHVDLTGRLFDILTALDVPVIAAVDGAAVGGGLEILLCCDIVVATATARFGLPEVKLGLIPGAGGTQRLARRCGRMFAAELMLTGRLVVSAEARAAGLITEVTQDSALPRAREIAARIAGFAPGAVTSGKRALSGGAELSLREGLALERELFVTLMSASETAVGLQAFLSRSR